MNCRSTMVVEPVQVLSVLATPDEVRRSRMLHQSAVAISHVLGRLPGASAIPAEAGWLDQLPVDVVDSVGQPALHQVDLALIGAPARFEPPSFHLSRLGLPQLVSEAVDQAVQVGQGEMGPAQFLPAVDPLLPEIRVTEKLRPPGAAGSGLALPPDSRRKLRRVPAGRYAQVAKEGQASEQQPLSARRDFCPARQVQSIAAPLDALRAARGDDLDVT